MTHGTRPTRSSKTVQDYESLYVSLKGTLGRQFGFQDITPNEMVAALLVNHRDGAYTKNTWRRYKAAVLQGLRTHHPEYTEAIDLLEATSDADLPKHSELTSSLKAKKVPNLAFEVLTRALLSRLRTGHTHASAMLAVFQATILTGLRPNEWAHALIGEHQKTGRRILEVQNSKHSNGRANGEARSMFIDRLAAKELGIIERAIAAFKARQTDEAIEKYLKQLRKELDSTKRAILKSPEITPEIRASLKGVSLYSCRHQFVADAKRDLANNPDGPAILAALLGHNSADTAPLHYGKRRCGKSAIKVWPTPESIEAVTKKTMKRSPMATARKEQSKIGLGFDPF
ncbi:MAG: hypothetical protein H6R19_2090 [Proteobacteria bacterium]|nr:hypothetical protein [Pseudomonadota bacterium]